VIEIMRFRLPPDGDEAAFLAADRRVQEEFVYQQPGLTRRTTARGERGDWIVITMWRSAADADAFEARAEHDELPRSFWAMLDRSSLSVERYQELD
jgi:heme-degrading monooxygenase HmoA